MPELAYHHDSSGKPIEGSLDALIQGILAGRQVRAVVHDDVGYIAYNDFSTVRVNQNQSRKLVVANLPIRPAVNNYGLLADKFNGYGLSVATIDSLGNYARYDEKDPGTPMRAQYEVRWFLDRA